MRRALVIAAAGAALLAPGTARAAQSPTQQFFEQRILADDGTSKEIADLLRTNQGFVDRQVRFRDLTGDKKTDAVVRVQSGGAEGAVALYVFSTDTGKKGSELAVVFRSQKLNRAETRIRHGVLRYRSARYQPGDEVCCPSKLVESRARWQKRKHRLKVVERREIAPGAPWGDQITPGP
jgi:hypothetical protein